VERILLSAVTAHDAGRLATYANADDLARSVVAKYGRIPALGVVDKDRVGFGAII
jgi:hypothetical protein